jgi:Rrf2 family protein
MQITKETDYAIRCVLYLSSNPGRAVSASEIMKAQDVPLSFASKILQKLSKAALVRSSRGANGGYILNRDPGDITLLDVYEASSGPLALNVCVVNKKTCSRSGTCPVHPVWLRLTEDLSGKMKAWNFKRLLRSHERNSGKRGGIRKWTKKATTILS